MVNSDTDYVDAKKGVTHFLGKLLKALESNKLPPHMQVTETKINCQPHYKYKSTNGQSISVLVHLLEPTRAALPAYGDSPAPLVAVPHAHAQDRVPVLVLVLAPIEAPAVVLDCVRVVAAVLVAGLGGVSAAVRDRVS